MVSQAFASYKEVKNSLLTYQKEDWQWEFRASLGLISLPAMKPNILETRLKWRINHLLILTPKLFLDLRYSKWYSNFLIDLAC